MQPRLTSVSKTPPDPLYLPTKLRENREHAAVSDPMPLTGQHFSGSTRRY